MSAWRRERTTRLPSEDKARPFIALSLMAFAAVAPRFIDPVVAVAATSFGFDSRPARAHWSVPSIALAA